MNTHKILTCGGCGKVPEIVNHPEFTKAVAAECVCGRRTAWHTDDEDGSSGRDKAIAEFNYAWGFVEQPEPHIKRVEV